MITISAIEAGWDNRGLGAGGAAEAVELKKELLSWRINRQPGVSFFLVQRRTLNIVGTAGRTEGNETGPVASLRLTPDKSDTTVPGRFRHGSTGVPGKLAR
ncbi:hypothetical protein [Amycolatopsis thermophila]|uniref:Uncharacterized protein n=1 Tax=Amycolatopsis thermophila TaxID=206084 RepID=A0ABU0EZB1_9PSEU|nr:hypothetical protein [Amycolatopsis thermophila]MDQ0380660.1 hypothetical protein [Amycolatopsis thermophila]